MQDLLVYFFNIVQEWRHYIDSKSNVYKASLIAKEYCCFINDSIVFRDVGPNTSILDHLAVHHIEWFLHRVRLVMVFWTRQWVLKKKLTITNNEA